MLCLSTPDPFGLAHSFFNEMRTGEKVALVILAVLTWGCAPYLLISIQVLH
jgi:hypothetical protein